MKRTIVTLVTLLLIFFSAVVLLSEKTNYVLAQIEIKGEAVEYELPFAGVLPDSPLYYLKTVRDNFWLFFTRDNMKKAEVLILFSDKKNSSCANADKKGEVGGGRRNNAGSRTKLQAHG